MGYGSASGNASSLNWYVQDWDISGDEAFGSTSSGVITENVPFKVALALEENNVYGFGDGTKIGSTDTSVSIPITKNMKTLIIGSGNGGRTQAEPHNGHIRKVTYYPERLPEAELAALTEND